VAKFSLRNLLVPVMVIVGCFMLFKLSYTKALTYRALTDGDIIAVQRLPYAQLFYPAPLAIIGAYLLYLFYLKGKKTMVAVAVSVVSFTVFYFTAYVGISAVKDIFYLYWVALNDLSVKGKAYRSDEFDGYGHVKNSEGSVTMLGGKLYHVYTDSLGCRVPAVDTLPATNTCGVYVTGCSYSFGYSVEAEETYSYQLQRAIGCKVNNFAVNGYGLAQMLHDAEKNLPQTKPNFLIAQYSCWLINRGVTRYSPIQYGVLPSPYFAYSGDSIVLKPAEFVSTIFSGKEVDFSVYPINTRGERIKLLWAITKFWMPKACKDYLRKFAFDLKVALHIIKPVYDTKVVENYAYSQLYNLCAANNVNMLILNLSDRNLSANGHRIKALGNQVKYIEADQALKGALGNADYSKQYGNWAKMGRDTVLVDVHPNAKAHAIIAREVTNTIAAINTIPLR
jgi:hypothetical protein